MEGGIRLDSIALWVRVVLGSAGVSRVEGLAIRERISYGLEYRSVWS